MSEFTREGRSAFLCKTALAGAVVGLALTVAGPVSAASQQPAQAAQAQLPPGHAAPQAELASWVQRNGFACTRPASMRKARPAAPGWTTWHIKCESGWYRVTYANRNRVFAEPL